jgi:hypothetical protein
MGVFLWTRFLYDEEWIPPAKCCSTSLWFERAHARSPLSSRWAQHTKTLLRGSELHMDGYSICFHIWEVAYARHIQSVTGKSTCCVTVKQTSVLNLQTLLPSSVPLPLVATVTREFVETLLKQGMKLSVYWDGDERVHFKQSTDTQRKDEADDEWGLYHAYCETGQLPRKNAKLCELRWPKSRCFTACVLQAMRNVSMVFCTEEADAAIAKAVSGKPNAFIVAWDSDFCFFKDCNYIPLPTLGLTDEQLVCGTVLRRDTIAAELAIPEELMVEAALLLGNDYVNRKDTTSPFSKAKLIAIEDVLTHLRSQAASYRVAGNDEAAVSFVRNLYDLQDTSEIARYHQDDLVESNVADSVKPRLPDSVDLLLLELDGGAPTVKGAVLRCLREYIAKTGGNGVLKIEHIELFESFQAKTYPQSFKALWRPTWSSVTVVNMIERLLQECIWINRDNPQMRKVGLSDFWSPYHFHWKLHTVNETMLASKTMEPEPRPEDSKSRPILPVDEFKDIILDSVRRQRVTIIQGETGCGMGHHSLAPILTKNCLFRKVLTDSHHAT